MKALLRRDRFALLIIAYALLSGALFACNDTSGPCVDAVIVDSLIAPGGVLVVCFTPTMEEPEATEAIGPIYQRLVIRDPILGYRDSR
jgi:hypothetical protein